MVINKIEQVTEKVMDFQKEIAIRQNEAETDAHIAEKRAVLDKEVVPDYRRK